MTVKDAGTNINIRHGGIPSGRENHLTRVTRLRAPPGARRGRECTYIPLFHLRASLDENSNVLMISDNHGDTKSRPVRGIS